MRIKSTCLIISFSFLIFNPFNSFSANDSVKQDTLAKPDSIHHNFRHDLKVGERLFHGMVVQGKSKLNCASCHNTEPIDTFNWNPSALDIARKFSGASLDSFKIALTQPSGQVMANIHDSLELSDENIRQIKTYLQNLATTGEKPLKPKLTNRILFILLIILFMLAIIDLAFTRKIKIKAIHFITLIATSTLITVYIVNAAIEIGRSPDYQPDQPIKFSHQIHAGQNKTNCLYCHFNAEQSKFAGIPPAQVCMNCHILVREGVRSGKFEIAKLYQAIETNKPISWIKVYNVPDHVYFNHAQHVVAGKIDCAKCHGDVAQMTQIKQVTDLSMGWCVKCHRETGIQFDNKFYERYEQVHKDLKEGKIKVVTAEKVGATDCMKCHY